MKANNISHYSVKLTNPRIILKFEGGTVSIGKEEKKIGIEKDQSAGHNYIFRLQ